MGGYDVQFLLGAGGASVMMMIIMDFTGFPASTVVTQRRNPKFSFKARFNEAKEHGCTKRMFPNIPDFSSYTPTFKDMISQKKIEKTK